MTTNELKDLLLYQRKLPCDLNLPEAKANFYDGFKISHFSPSVTFYKENSINIGFVE